MRTPVTRTFVLFGIRDNETRSPFLAAFVEAESFADAARSLAGTLVDTGSDAFGAYARVSELIPTGHAEREQFMPGPCTIEVLMGLRTDLKTQFARHQHMQYLQAQHDRCLGFVLAAAPSA